MKRGAANELRASRRSRGEQQLLLFINNSSGRGLAQSKGDPFCIRELCES